MADNPLMAFLTELSHNNNREWFQAHKEHYDALRNTFVHDVEHLISLLARHDPEVRGLRPQDCIYRIYRDIRFSPDKSPYKNYFSAYIARGGKKSLRAGYYLHLQPGNVMLCGGVWCPPSPLLRALRQAIYDNLDEWTGIVDDPAFRAVYPHFEGEVLKTVPRPFPKEGEHTLWMRRKDYIAACHLPDDWHNRPQWVELTARKLLMLKPMNDFLNYTVDDFA